MIMNRLIMMFLITSPTAVVAEVINKTSEITTLPSSPVDVGSVFQVIAALLVIVFLILAMSWMYKKYGASYISHNSGLKVVSALSLGGKEKAVLIQVGDEQVLLGVSPGYVRKIHDVNEPISVNENFAENNFIAKLNKEISKVVNK